MMIIALGVSSQHSGGLISALCKQRFCTSIFRDFIGLTRNLTTTLCNKMLDFVLLCAATDGSSLAHAATSGVSSNTVSLHTCAATKTCLGVYENFLNHLGAFLYAERERERVSEREREREIEEDGVESVDHHLTIVCPQEQAPPSCMTPTNLASATPCQGGRSPGTPLTAAPRCVRARFCMRACAFVHAYACACVGVCVSGGGADPADPF